GRGVRSPRKHPRLPEADAPPAPPVADRAADRRLEPDAARGRAALRGAGAMKNAACKHEERHTRADGAVVDRHDCDYVLARNALIPEAERMASAVTPPNDRPMLWAREFMLAMDRLARQRGLVRTAVRQ